MIFSMLVLHPHRRCRFDLITHPSTLPQLLTLSMVIGTGGSHIKVMDKQGDKFTLLTRPLVFSEKMEPLGSQGDILLADFSQYAVGIRKEMRLESSVHMAFQTDEIAHRCIVRVNGRPLWDEALTLENGSTTVSLFIVLEERA